MKIEQTYKGLSMTEYKVTRGENEEWMNDDDLITYCDNGG